MKEQNRVRGINTDNSKIHAKKPGRQICKGVFVNLELSLKELSLDFKKATYSKERYELAMASI